MECSGIEETVSATLSSLDRLDISSRYIRKAQEQSTAAILRLPHPMSTTQPPVPHHLQCTNCTCNTFYDHLIVGTALPTSAQ